MFGCFGDAEAATTLGNHSMEVGSMTASVGAADLLLTNYSSKVQSEINFNFIYRMTEYFTIYNLF